MESIEKQATLSLRVMRFCFEPNQNLQEELGLQLDAKWSHLTPLRLFASQQLMMSVKECYRQEGALSTIAKKFRDIETTIQLKPSIRSKQITEETTRFQLLPSDQVAFDRLTSIQVVANKKLDTYDPFAPVEQFDNLIKNQPDSGHYLFFDVPTNARIGEEHRVMRNRAFLEKAALGRFFLHSTVLSEKDMYYSVDQQSPEQTSTGTQPGAEHQLSAAD